MGLPKFVDHYPVILKQTIVCCLINYVSGVECSHEFLINNFINIFIINHRVRKRDEDEKEKVLLLKRHVETMICVLDGMAWRMENNQVSNIVYGLTLDGCAYKLSNQKKRAQSLFVANFVGLEILNAELKNFVTKFVYERKKFPKLLRRTKHDEIIKILCCMSLGVFALKLLSIEGLNVHRLFKH